MRLISCPDCKTEVSDKALDCPFCGWTLVPFRYESFQSQNKSVRGKALARLWRKTTEEQTKIISDMTAKGFSLFKLDDCEVCCIVCGVAGKTSGTYCPIFIRKECPNQLILEREEKREYEEAVKKGKAYRKRIAYMKNHKKMKS